MTEKKNITALDRVAGFVVLQNVLDSKDYKFAPAVNVTLFEALCEREIKRKYMETVKNDVLYVMREARDIHEIEHGERPIDADDAEEWDDALDDAIYDAVVACGQFSAGFVGARLVDTRAHDDAELNALAVSAAEAAWSVARMHTDIKEARALTPRELLDKLDVTRSMVEAYVNAYTAPTPEEVKEHKMATRQETLTKLHYAFPLYDGTAEDYKAELEQTLDSDDILSGASLERVGCGPEDKQNIADWLAELSYDLDAALEEINDTKHALTPSQVAAEAATTVETEDEEEDEEAELAALMGTAAPTEPAAPAAPPATAGAAPAKPARAKRQVATGDDPNVIPALLLSRLKDTLGEKDEVLATGCGMSRATFNNYIKGKGAFVASDDQFNFLRDMAIKRRDDLNAIIAEMGER